MIFVTLSFRYQSDNGSIRRYDFSEWLCIHSVLQSTSREDERFKLQIQISTITRVFMKYRFLKQATFRNKFVTQNQIVIYTFGKWIALNITGSLRKIYSIIFAQFFDCHWRRANIFIARQTIYNFIQLTVFNILQAYLDIRGKSPGWSQTALKFVSVRVVSAVLRSNFTE